MYSIFSEEFHTIVLNSNGAVVTRFFRSILFHMDFNTVLFTDEWINPLLVYET